MGFYFYGGILWALWFSESFLSDLYGVSPDAEKFARMVVNASSFFVCNAWRNIVWFYWVLTK
jgi:hypothetical protein